MLNHTQNKNTMSKLEFANMMTSKTKLKINSDNTDNSPNMTHLEVYIMKYFGIPFLEMHPILLKDIPKREI